MSDGTPGHRSGTGRRRAAERELRRFAAITGVVLGVVGIAGVVFGAHLYELSGDGLPDADANTRFNSAIVLGVAMLWLRVARSSSIDRPPVAVLGAALLLGALARVLSIPAAGVPGVLTLAQSGVEIMAAAVVLLLLTVLRDTPADSDVTPSGR